METKMENIMKQIGWTDGYHVPLLNEENTQLTNKIEGMLKQKAIFMIQSEDLANSVSSVEKNLKDMKSHYQHNQELVYACKTYKETEDHMTKLSISNEKIAKKDISKYSLACKETSSRIGELESEIGKLKQRINEIEKNAQFDHGTILLWEEEIIGQEELSQVIEFYAHEDGIKAKEQNLLIGKLQLEARNKQKKLEKLSYETRAQELALEHASNLFRKIHADRQFLIKKWEGCVSFVGKRDEEIMILRNEIDGLLRNFSQLRESLQDEMCFLSGLEQNNRETELKTKCSDREASLLLEIKVKSKQRVEQIENEINVVSRSLANTGKLLQQERCNCKFLTKRNSDMNNCVKKLDKVIGVLRDRLKDVCSHHISANERRAQLEDILMAEEANLTEVENELKNVQYNIFINQSHLQKLKEKELSLSTSISGIESSLKLLTNEKILISKKIVQKFQMVYNLDYQIEKQESRISRMMGYQESGKQEELVNKMNKLEEVLLSKNKEYKFLSLQKTKFEDEERRLLTALEAGKEQLKSLISRNGNESLCVQVTETRLKDCYDINQNLQVEENVMRLKISKTKSAVDKKGREIFSLEKQYLEIDKLMRERTLEIAMEKDVLEAKHHAVADEVSMLRCEVKHIQTKISHLKKRYEIMTSCISGNVAKCEEPLSLIQFNLKIAQEKQELQEEGDRLEKEIHLAEKEICSMEAALRIISGTNDAYKNNLIAFDEGAPELVEKDILEKKLLSELNKRRKKNFDLLELQNATSSLSQEIKELDEQIAEISNTLKEENVLLNSLSNEIEEQVLKKSRAYNQARRLQTEVRNLMGTISGAEPTFDEREFYVQQLILANKNGMILLAQLQDHNPGIVSQIEKFLEEKGLIKFFEMSKTQIRRSSQMILSSPKLMPPVNTPVSSPEKPSCETISSSKISPSLPSALVIDGAMFNKGEPE